MWTNVHMPNWWFVQVCKIVIWIFLTQPMKCPLYFCVIYFTMIEVEKMNIFWVGSEGIYFVNLGSKVITSRRINSVLWDLSKNVSFKFLAQILLELLVKEWRDVVVKRNFWGKFQFLGGRISRNTWPIFLQFGTVASIMDVNRHVKFEQNLRWVVLKSAKSIWHSPKFSRRCRFGNSIVNIYDPRCVVTAFTIIIGYLQRLSWFLS